MAGTALPEPSNGDADASDAAAAAAADEQRRAGVAAASGRSEEELMDELDSLGFFNVDDDSDEDDIGLAQAPRAPTTPRGRKRMHSVGRRRHLPRGSQGR